jgi:hypothetical protein
MCLRGDPFPETLEGRICQTRIGREVTTILFESRK